jgi:hypothetical protein
MRRNTASASRASPFSAVVHPDRIDVTGSTRPVAHALGFTCARVIEVGVDLLQNRRDRARMHGRLLADVELQQVEAEAFDQPDQRLQPLHGDDAVVMADQRVPQQVQVVEEGGIRRRDEVSSARRPGTGGRRTGWRPAARMIAAMRR